MKLSQLLLHCQARPGATDSQISALEHDLGQSLPDDYKAILLEHDGIEGFVTTNQYLLLWSAEEIRWLNNAYSTEEYLQGVILLGTNGGDTAYGFTSRNDSSGYISVPLVGMGPDEAVRVGATFIELLNWLRESDVPAPRG